jgi:uncharacterized phiE125 gp8 family phage protein
LAQVVAPTVDELDLEFVRDQHLRGVNGSAEDPYIERLMRTSNQMAHRVTRRSLQTQTWTLTLERFPDGDIVLPRPPLQSVTSIAYIDTSGVTQTLDGGSPELFQVLAPQGALAARGRVRPVMGESWPETHATALGAVVVTFVAGYPTVDDIPEDITHGRLLVIGELFKQRSDSVHGPGLVQSPAIIGARSLWLGYRVY